MASTKHVLYTRIRNHVGRKEYANIKMTDCGNQSETSTVHTVVAGGKGGEKSKARAEGKCTEVGGREMVEKMLTEVSGVAGLLEVPVLEQLLGRRAAVRVLVQAARHQIKEGLGQQRAFLVVFGAGRGQLEAVVDHSCWTQVIIGRFSEGQLQA
jgi:hypothetical protein